MHGGSSCVRRRNAAPRPGAAGCTWTAVPGARGFVAGLPRLDDLGRAAVGEADLVHHRRAERQRRARPSPGCRRRAKRRCSGRRQTIDPAARRERNSSGHDRAADVEPHGAVRRDGAGQHVGLADEAVDEQAGRPVVDLGRRRELLQPAGRQHGDAVRHRQRFLLVVGDEDRRRAGQALDALDLDLHVEAQVLVQRRERLVQQQDCRLHRQRAGQRDALLLAARQRARQPRRRGGPAARGPACAPPRAVAPPRPRRARPARRRRCRRRSCAGTARSSGTRCRPAGGWAAAGRSRLPPTTTCPAVCAHQPGDDPQQRRLAAAGRPEQRHQLAAANVERHRVHRRRAGVTMGDAVQQQRLAGRRGNAHRR